MNADIPCYLRTEKNVTNRKIGRNELEDLISGFWEYRSMKIAEGDTCNIGTIDEITYEYLLARNEQKEDAAIEDGYNLRDACSRFQHIIHIEVFNSILNGDTDEEVYNSWITTQVKFIEAFKNNSVQIEVT